MSPREEFNRTKRWAGLAAAFLITHLLVGVEQTDSGGLFGITLKNTSSLDEVLFLIMIVFTLKSINLWTMLDDQYRRTIQYRVDDLLSLILSGYSAILYLTKLDIEYPSFQGWFGERFDIFIALLSTSGAIVSAFFAFRKMNTIRISATLKIDVAIIQMLCLGEWYLVFANARARATQGQVGWKKISFNENGEIGEGRNHNEYRWNVKNGYLEIYNNKDEIFSRFVRSDDGFKATDDSDVKALPGQEIVRDIELWKQRV